MTDDLKTLSRKGAVTVVEHVGGKTMVAIQFPSGNIVTLKNGEKNQLLAELCQIVKNWPDVTLNQQQNNRWPTG